MYPNTDDFNIGYFEGQTKIRLVTSDDINSMYSKYDKGGQITIWCDGRLSESYRETTRKQKHHDEGGVGSISSPLRVCGTTSCNQVERRQVSSYFLINTPSSVP